MQQSVIFEKVKHVLVKTLNTTAPDEIQKNSNLKNDLGLDSMSSLTFLMALEDNIDGFIVDPDTLSAGHLENVESISQYVASQLDRNVEHVA